MERVVLTDGWLDDYGEKCDWPFARYFCRDCGGRFYAPLRHKTLGDVCPGCLKPTSKASAPTRGVGGSKTSTAKRRKRIAERDGWKCHLCGLPVHPTGRGKGSATIDHVIPVSKGGSNALENLRLAHSSCNFKRGNADLS